jgi:predicted DNA-binding protein YlxM (UPF0122 family)
MVNKIIKIKQEQFLKLITKITQEEFLKLYKNKDLTIKEIAKQLEVSSQAIYRLARQLGVKRRDKIK